MAAEKDLVIAEGGGKKKLLLIGGGAALLIVLGVVGFMFLSGGDDAAAPTASGNEASASAGADGAERVSLATGSHRADGAGSPIVHLLASRACVRQAGTAASAASANVSVPNFIGSRSMSWSPMAPCRYRAYTPSEMTAKRKLENAL